MRRWNIAVTENRRLEIQEEMVDSMLWSLKKMDNNGTDSIQLGKKIEFNYFPQILISENQSNAETDKIKGCFRGEHFQQKASKGS